MIDCVSIIFKISAINMYSSSQSNGVSSVLFLKISRCDNETDECFLERQSLYKKTADKHNMSVWQSLPWERKMVESVGKLRECMFESENTMFKDFNPYVDSGFDIFQPAHNGNNSSFYHPNTTHLLKLGIAGAMYTLHPEDNYFNIINWELTNTRRAFENSTADSKIMPYGGVYSQILFGHGSHLINSICNDINQGHSHVGRGGGGPDAGTGGSVGDAGETKFNNEPVVLDGTRCHAMPQPYCLHPRSSIYKKAIRLANSTGIIDSGYRGELAAAVDILSGELSSGFYMESITHMLDSNKRYFQICKPDLSPFYVCIIDELPNTSRGAGGFGSTGN